MDWNELIRIWGAGHPGHEEPEIEKAALHARRARERRHARMARRVESSVDSPRRKEGPTGIGPTEAGASA